MIKNFIKMHDADIHMLDTYLSVYDTVLARCEQHGLILDVSDVCSNYVELLSIGGGDIPIQIRKEVFGGLERFRKY